MSSFASGESRHSVEIPTLALVVPCYNETEAFSHCLAELSSVLAELTAQRQVREDSYILFVDDGSRDDTWHQITRASETYPHVRGLKLSGNRGHQTALMAGLAHVDADASISIDADLQDDTGCIAQMVEKYMQGVDIVYGVRNDRSSDSAFKRGTANGFYRLMDVMGVHQVANHADYRLLSRRALQSLLMFRERNLYIRGMIPQLGFRTDKVFYSRDERIAGESKYPLKKMLSLALEGITSLTITPLRLISVLGLLTCVVALCAVVYALIEKFTGGAIEGWTSVVMSIFFLGGVQLLCLGVIGEYVGRIYMETKGRPRFFIEESVGGKHEAE